MIERESLNAVSLCVSPAVREPLICAAAAKGVALFIEKPWATNVTHAQHLAALCAEVGARAMVAFSFRFHPTIVRLRELLDGELGPGWMLNAEYAFNWRPPAGNWLWDSANGGGFINENSCHLFDAVNYMLGRPVAVTAEGGNFTAAPSEDAAAITLRYEGGAIAALTCGSIAAQGFREYPRLDLITRDGQAHLTGREHIGERLTWTLRGSDTVYGFTHPPEMSGYTRYTRAFQHFLARLRDGGPFAVTPVDGVATVAMAMAVYESARTGRRVTL